MFLQLAHTKTDLFATSKSFALECYKVTRSFPPDERFAMTQQIRRAALSVHLNIAEGCSRKSIAERKRFFEIARGSVIEIDTAFDMAVNLEYTSPDKLIVLGQYLVSTFKQLSAIINHE
ncbi:four helix bundle protein [Lacibacter luteus]|uniref:Four helix bundle protein n=1 Tax=Lacibacter luteus TaxID=2508719 RepID=A0A4Q1CHU0_9BACT|nr:four helix bundle protein [Lacibacter luteus]RXK59918.1 four helix bundle protein [Lacibacter luteus]